MRSKQNRIFGFYSPLFIVMYYGGFGDFDDTLPITSPSASTGDEPFGAGRLCLLLSCILGTILLSKCIPKDSILMVPGNSRLHIGVESIVAIKRDCTTICVWRVR